MTTLIEDLPIELWISIFSYLEAHDLLRAFTNLNTYFDRLIVSDHLLLNVQIGKSDHNPLDYSIQSYWPDSILHRIISLRPLVQHKTSHIPEFLRWHCTKLTQLKHLEVKVRGREIPTLCLVVQQLKSLQSLSIESIPNQMLLEAILCVPSLRVCQLNFSESTISIDNNSKQISNVEKLDIKVKGDQHNSILGFLLNRMPNLKRLEISSSENYFDHCNSPFFNQAFILPELQTLKLKWSSAKSDPNFFENLHDIVPNLKYIDFNFIHNYSIEHLFNHLIYRWWPVIEKLQRIHVFIKCAVFQSNLNNNLQIQLNKFQSILLAMNEEYNGHVQFKYTENFFVAYKTIEISICKIF